MSAIKLKEVAPILATNYLAGVNTFMQSKPAVGKTQSVEAWANEMVKRVPDFKLYQFYAPTMSPMDIVASAPDYETGKLKLYANAAMPNAYDDADMKGCIFIDEMPNADQATLKLLQKYVNGEDMSGVLRKPVGVMVVAAGNRLEDKSGVQQHGRAYLSRFEQFTVHTEATDNIEFANRHAWHPMVQTFFKEHVTLIDNYDEVFETGDAVGDRADANKKQVRDKMTEEGKRGIWCNMRAWERVSKKEYIAEQMGRELTAAEVAGNIGTAAAAQYAAHKRIVNNLASFDQIMKDPHGVQLPTKMDEQYILALIIAMRADASQLQQVYDVGQRFPLEMQAVILRSMSKRKGFALASSPVYGKWMLDPKLNALITGR